MLLCSLRWMNNFRGSTEAVKKILSLADDTEPGTPII
jgi:hypothetical protein